MGEERQEQTGLFNGTKFWLSRSVPHRAALIQQLKENRGVLLEHTPGADILIVDPARQDNPVNSFSYKYIEKSIEKGEIANLEDYRAGRAPGTSRPVGSSTLAKKTRNPYTLTEDRELREYVLQCEKEGKPTSGRVIYEEYEKTHPQHTWQSWRDRWVKILAVKYGPLTESVMPLELESSSSTATKVKDKKDEQKGGQAMKKTPDNSTSWRETSLRMRSIISQQCR
ncbi:hypothetical protein KEM56_006837 [Ascosphaera pollenicola]|nr:hypothetical protein KEM56_006837 [Ascosphaera pollenicola]